VEEIDESKKKELSTWKIGKRKEFAITALGYSRPCVHVFGEIYGKEETQPTKFIHSVKSYKT
jgi:hypothetical protein